MNWIRISVTFLFLLFAWSDLCAKEDSTLLKAFEDHHAQALRYRDLSLHLESIEQLNVAITIAKENGWAEKFIEANITLAEVLRSTRDFERSLEVLLDLNDSENYPLLHVRKLGRVAAVYNEMSFSRGGEQYDSVRLYLDKAIELAVANEFRLEEASLKNELGYLISRNGGRALSQPILLESASLYQQHNDTQGYVRAMLNALDNYNWLHQDSKVDSLSKVLEDLVEGKNWFLTQLDLFNVIARVHQERGDTIGYWEWTSRAHSSHIGQIASVQSGSMAAFRVIYETEKFQNEALQKAAALEKQEARTRELIIYLSLLVVLVLVVLALLLRERRLKRKVDSINLQLNVANEKYHMLLVESNHRIKNNLQMIISMLEYASKDLGDENSVAFQRMSSKIHTISALHKHLYLDVHNERVSMDTYFGEITHLYREFDSVGFSIEKRVDAVSVKSERIVYFGLIFNEMLANTIEHNQSAQKKAFITVRAQGDHFLFDYHDGSSWENTVSSGTGSLLIKQLIQRVGGTNFHFDPSKGLYQFEFFE